MSLSKLEEALKRSIFPPTYKSVGGDTEAEWIDDMHLVFDAARRYSRLVGPCTTCEGTGWLSTEPEGLEPLSCWACVKGVVPSEQAIEVLARKWFDIVGERSGVDLAFETAYDSEQADFREQASRLLVALLEGTE